MTPYYADDWLTVYLGDCREFMAAMEPESVHCVVTSPPYWGLRDYGIGGQLGLEPTPEAYVEAMVAVFREVRRVLRKDGTVWLNLGDSYFGTGRGPTHPTGMHAGDNGSVFPTTGVYSHDTLKGKDLVGIPWRVAFALQADGWYLRSDIIWAKPNPMPESVTDRPTKAHEYVFLLSKSPRYYYDSEAVREPHNDRNRPVGKDGLPVRSKHDGTIKNRHNNQGWRSGGGMFIDEVRLNPAGRNLRSVWNIATEPYPGAHFATFPRALVEPCIKAGTSAKGVCPKCGAPWVREVERSYLSPIITTGTEEGRYTAGRNRNVTRMGDGVDVKTTGWRPSCACCRLHPTGLCLCEAFPASPESIPATVLDPFAGSGTTGLVAQSLSRRAVLIDLSADYLEQLMDRNRDIPLGLAGG